VIAAPAWIGVAAWVVILDLAIYLQRALPCCAGAVAAARTTPTSIRREHRAALPPIEICCRCLSSSPWSQPRRAALSVLIFGVLLNASSMFNHANIRITRIDRILRWLVVTPDMHRVHHSILARETNSNFGFNLPWWDRLFGTYRPQPAAGHGHDHWHRAVPRSANPVDRTLAQPFRGGVGEYPLGRRGVNQ
jgi:hypothetical protein